MNRSVGNIAMRRFSVSGFIRLLAIFEALNPSPYDNFIKAVFAVCNEEAEDNLEEEDRLETEPA